MPNMTAVVRFNKIPSTGLVPETSGTAPSSPVNGQLWVDTSVTPRLLRVWDGSVWAVTNVYPGTTSGSYAAGNDTRITGSEQQANKGVSNGYASLDASVKVPIAQIPTGSTGTTVPLGNDTRFSDQRVPTDNSVTGGTTGAGVKIAASTITDANVATANKDGLANVASLRTLGTTATQATAGNDSRLSDTRTPTALSVTDSSVSFSAAIAESKLALASDAAAGTASRRTLGSGAQQAAAGNDSRFTDSRTPTAGSVVDASVSASAAIAESKLALASDAAAGVASRRSIGTTALQAMSGSTRLDTIAAPSGSVSLNGQRITGLGAPTIGSDAARLADVQAAASGIDNKPSVRVATVGNITLTGTQTIDGVLLVAGDRVLVKNQTVGTENGSYVVAAGAWARADETITANSFWFAEEGTANADTSWMVTNNGVITIGTTNLAVSQFGAPGSVSGTANRITVTGSVVDIASNYIGQTSITSVGVLSTGSLGAGFTTVTVAQGGTGATTPAGARANLGVAQLGYAATLGAVTAGTAFTVTHNLGTQDVIAQVRDASTNEYIFLDVVNASANTVTITSGVGFATNALRIVILPVA